VLRCHVNGHEMAYIAVGDGRPLVCLHGSLGDFRVWSSVLGPLSRHYRVIAPSLRRFFPEHWNGIGEGFTIAEHVADVIAFIEAIGQKVNLLAQSRGGHIAFRVAQYRPDLVRRLVLAEPGGDLDASIRPEGFGELPSLHALVTASAALIAAGDVDGGLESYMDAIDRPGVWRSIPEAIRQQIRDNAGTLVGQVNEQRQPYRRSDAAGLLVPTLFLQGENTSGALPIISRVLAAHVPGARTEVIPNTSHAMFEQDPVRFCAVVLKFLAET
jgi:pimeloyl-ACP methyl ester carboxylesterase